MWLVDDSKKAERSEGESQSFTNDLMKRS